MGRMGRVPGTAAALCLLLAGALGGWIDPDTSLQHLRTTSLVDGREHQLVMSDEFEREGRTFHDGHDPRWTAMHKNDYTNQALHFYNADLVSTSNGYLNITTIVKDVTFRSHSRTGPEWITKNYQSAMVQSWNKFCFTGGIIEVSARLPGNAYIGGLWPALWLMGNLARATYVGSSDNIWPWSYDTCDREKQRSQKISACDAAVHYGMHKHQGRGAPEVDIIEAMPGRRKLQNSPVDMPYFSTSLQVSPGVEKNRPKLGHPTKDYNWYNHGLVFGKNSSENIFFFGVQLEHLDPETTYQTDAISANTNLTESHFSSFHIYRVEWVPGDGGYLRWYLDNQLVFGISADALNITGAIIPEEPMYILFNTAISSTWGFPEPCPKGCACDCFDCRAFQCQCAVPRGMCDNIPAHFLIDYVRVYQAVDDDSQTVGCSTRTHPTKKFIQAHANKYKDPTDEAPLKPLRKGGHSCRSARDCGGPTNGDCVNNVCECRAGWVGPRCLAAQGFNDIDYDAEPPVEVHGMYIPTFLACAVAVAGVALLSLTAWNYLEKRRRRAAYMRIPPDSRHSSHVDRTHNI